jgi:hypothetical protein
LATMGAAALSQGGGNLPAMDFGDEVRYQHSSGRSSNRTAGTRLIDIRKRKAKRKAQGKARRVGR